MHEKLSRIQISHQELLGKSWQFFFIPVLIIKFISLNFHQSLNWHMSLLSLKNVIEIIRKTIYKSAYFKIFELCLFCQISSFIDSHPPKQQFGFRKVYSTQYYLLLMLEKWKNAVDKGKCFGALLTDLSKAFDSLFHELLIAKLHAHGFELPPLKFIQSYSSNRKQRTKINATYSPWEQTSFVFILRPLLFNIFLCDLFLTMCETGCASYVDKNTPYVSRDSIYDVIKSLEDDYINLFT